MKKRLITSALPYVNNIPHLGNLIQVLSADVFARFCRSRGYETLYVCGTDEYGTATETRALEEGITPKQLCSRYFEIHDDIYRWFNISFDKFGRTSAPEHTEITQDIFLKLDKNGYITERTEKQLYSEKSGMFLADRYVRGTCPHCGYEEARGDQCENCGKLLDPMELVNPRSAFDESTPVVRETTHLYIDLPAIRPRLEAWIDQASKSGFWANNAIKMTRAWIRDGLKERTITRDLKWGIPVPKDGFRDKVFYVWFDAPIGYISITATLTKQWEKWWKNPEEVELFQFVGKDNIPFHTVVFPSSLLGSGDRWTMLHHMSSTEYLNYEAGKFSKSKGMGVFGTDAMETGIPADVWRFYMYYNRPETSDYLFTWDDFQEKVNGELIGNLANLVNRTLTFGSRYFDGKLPELPPGREAESREFWEHVRKMEKEITDRLERAELREAFRRIFALASYGNKAFQDGEPWKTRKTDPEAAGRLLRDLILLVRDLAVLVEPYLPETSGRILKFLEVEQADWSVLAETGGVKAISAPEILFQRFEDEQVHRYRERFSGSQKEREMEADSMLEESAQNQGKSLEEQFVEQVDLRVAKIIDIERHPKADKLYVETIDMGEGETRTIVSGLVPYYKEEDLKGRHVVVVANLKTAKLRGIESQGMLLAAEEDEIVEVVFADFAEPGTPVLPTGFSAPAEPPAEIEIDDFFEVPIAVTRHFILIGDSHLEADGITLKVDQVNHGSVG
ncbi:MAG: methionine--tRNA ligase [Spirochaetales bacterium]|nr:methionine--tRNA ligase [Spirochaetales bacterium]MCF7937864.1 methionine--tRNA ligase [Spirochaetales bacterium]